MLLLFDIDGTLLSNATDAHVAALHAALLEVHGVDARGRRAPISPAGRTDGEIARAILLDAGVSAQQIDERADLVREVCCREHAALCTADLSHTVLPGVGELLEALAARADTRLSLLTGNYEPVARVKLRRAGIGHWFASGQGAFGSDSEDRAALPAIARRRAGADAGHPYPRERTIVIGDTPLDIACARADGVRCIGVSTGRFAAQELSEADAVSEDATGLAAVIDAMSDHPEVHDT